jgi:hypothetical protein
MPGYGYGIHVYSSERTYIDVLEIFTNKTVQLYILLLQLQYLKKKKQIFFPLWLGFVPVFDRIVTKMHCRYLGGIALNKSVFLNLRAGNN